MAVLKRRNPRAGAVTLSFEEAETVIDLLVHVIEDAEYELREVRLGHKKAGKAWLEEHEGALKNAEALIDVIENQMYPWE